MFFWTQFAQKRGHYGPYPRWKKLFLAEITKADHPQLSENFYFIKISYVLTELYLFRYWVMFSVKKVSFPAKTAVLRILSIFLVYLCLGEPWKRARIFSILVFFFFFCCYLNSSLMPVSVSVKIAFLTRLNYCSSSMLEITEINCIWKYGGYILPDIW